MLRSRLGLLGLCGIVIGLMAFMPSSASASEWLILTSAGVNKTASELPTSVVMSSDGGGGGGSDWDTSFLVIGIMTRVSCTSVGLTGTKLEAGGKLTNGGKFRLIGCTVPTPTGCTVKSNFETTGTIVSNSFKGQLQESGEILIEPSTAGAPLSELVFEGATCSLPTGVTEPINGVTWFKDCEGKLHTHLVSHLLVASTAHGKTMYIGKDTAEHLELSLLGSALWRLGSTHAGLSWGAL